MPKAKTTASKELVLLKGVDQSKKEAQLLELKQHCQLTAEAEAFDWEPLLARKTSVDDLKKALLTMPVLATKRLIVLRDCDKCSTAQKDFLNHYIKAPYEHVVLVFDYLKPDGKQTLVKNLQSAAMVIDCGVPVVKSVFDMTKLMESGQATSAIKVLHELFAVGQHPLQIMGGLIWFWGRQRSRLSGENFYRGLSALEETDENLKRSRLHGEYAIEHLLLRLMSLMGKF